MATNIYGQQLILIRSRSHDPLYDLIPIFVLKDVITAKRVEEINGQNTLDFTFVLPDTKDGLFNRNITVDLDGDYFDLAYSKKQFMPGGDVLTEAKCEHISYRLNADVLETFASTGTVYDIMEDILDGTGFTIGDTEIAGEYTYTFDEEKTRRQLLIEFAEYVGGELEFLRKEIALRTHRGSTDPFLVNADREDAKLAEIFDAREATESDLFTSYEFAIQSLPASTYSLGDEIKLVSTSNLSLETYLRIVKVSYNPYNPAETIYEFATSTNLSSSLFGIMTNVVNKDKVYNGVSIGPSGFRATTLDRKGQVAFQSDNLAIRVGDGEGNWEDQLYFDTDPISGETVLVFAGRNDAGGGGGEAVILALEALDFYTNGFSADYEGVIVGYTWTKDIDGKITSLTSIDDETVIPVTWHAGEM